MGTDPWTSVLSTLAPGELERLYHHLHQLHREFSPDIIQEDSTDLPSPLESPTMSGHHRTDSAGHHRSDSAEIRDRESRQNSPNLPRPAGMTPRNDDPNDPLAVVYRAIIEDPDLVNKLADALRTNPRGLRGPHGLTGAPGAPGAAGSGDGGHWRADEVGFFFPDLHSSYGTTEIVTIGKDSFYPNASVFLDRLDDIVKLKGGELVRANLPTCLRGAALQWYMTELTDIEKASLRSLSNTQPQDTIYRWRQALKRRWDPPAALALQNFMNTKYTVNMARSGMSVVQYFATKLRLAKETGFDNVHQQLLAVWNGIDIEIRKHIDEPDETTSIDCFRRRLEDKERLWKEEMTTQRLRAQGNFLPTRCWNDEYRPTAPQPRFANVPYSPSPSGQILSSNRPFIPAGQGNYGGNRPPTQMAGIGPSPQRLQLTAGPSGTPNPTQARSPQ